MNWNDCVEEAKEELGISGWTRDWDEVMILAKEKYWGGNNFKNLKNITIELADGECELCYSTQNLTAHHIYYGKNGYGEETICVCKSCHNIIHGDLNKYGFILQLVLSNLTSGTVIPSNLMSICLKCLEELQEKHGKE